MAGIHPSHVEQLVRSYVEGWKRADRDAILRCLAPQCVVIESHGPTYQGIPQVSRWIDSWLEPGNKVTRWDITSLYIAGETCFFEWDFECIFEGKAGGFEGASIARRDNGQLGYLREYAMTAPRYEWLG